MIDNDDGFTLVELLVALTVAGILAGIAYPSYVEQLRSARRADAQGAMLGLAGALERYFTVKSTFKDAADANGTPLASVYKIPASSGAAAYDLKISEITDTTYTLTATPTASQQKEDRCGVLTLTHTGIRGIKNATQGVTVKECWR